MWRGDASLSVVLAGALVMNLLIAACLGSLVPIGLKLLGVDLCELVELHEGIEADLEHSMQLLKLIG